MKKTEFANYPEKLKEIVNKKDFRNNTPLLICIYKRLVKKSVAILKIMIDLLDNGAQNNLSRNSEQQTAFEISQCNNDYEAVYLIFDYILERRKGKIKRNLERARNFLSTQPNFSLEMKWDVKIKVPLASYFCPNDVCKIWKYDQNVRMNYSFAEFKNLSCIRIPSSWYFIGGFKNLLDEKGSKESLPEPEVNNNNSKIKL